MENRHKLRARDYGSATPRTVDTVVRTAFRLRWLPRHVLALVLIAALILLGRWQWDVSESPRGGLQNLLYAFQWWAMAVHGRLWLVAAAA